MYLCSVLPILAQVLFFLFQSTACSNKAEVRVQTSLISKPANIFWGFSTIYITHSLLKRGIETQRLDNMSHCLKKSPAFLFCGLT